MRKLGDRLVSDAKEYADLRLDDLKLRAVDGLSVGMSRIFTMMVLVVLMAIALAAFAFGAVLLLGDIIGSWTAAAFIVGGVFLAALAVLFFFRNRLFINMFVRLFINIFYGNE